MSSVKQVNIILTKPTNNVWKLALYTTKTATSASKAQSSYIVCLIHKKNEQS